METAKAPLGGFQMFANDLVKTRQLVERHRESMVFRFLLSSLSFVKQHTNKWQTNTKLFTLAVANNKGLLHSSGIELFLRQQGIDTTTPAGKAMFQMMGVFSEFERAMIRDRVNSGLARAKANGKVLVDQRFIT